MPVLKARNIIEKTLGTKAKRALGKEFESPDVFRDTSDKAIKAAKRAKVSQENAFRVKEQEANKLGKQIAKEFEIKKTIKEKATPELLRKALAEREPISLKEIQKPSEEFSLKETPKLSKNLPKPVKQKKIGAVSEKTAKKWQAREEEAKAAAASGKETTKGSGQKLLQKTKQVSKQEVKQKPKQELKKAQKKEVAKTAEYAPVPQKVYNVQLYDAANTEFEVIRQPAQKLSISPATKQVQQVKPASAISQEFAPITPINEIGRIVKSESIQRSTVTQTVKPAQITKVEQRSEQLPKVDQKSAYALVSKIAQKTATVQTPQQKTRTEQITQPKLKQPPKEKLKLKTRLRDQPQKPKEKSLLFPIPSEEKNKRRWKKKKTHKSITEFAPVEMPFTRNGYKKKKNQIKKQKKEDYGI
jgi:hypothetical protein